MSLTYAERRYRLAKSIPAPRIRSLIEFTSPVRILLSIPEIEFNGEASLSLQAVVENTVLGLAARPLSNAPVSFTVNNSLLADRVFTDQKGVAKANTSLLAGDYDIRAYLGPAVKENEIFSSKRVMVAQISVNSPVQTSITIDDKGFTTPKTVLLPFFNGKTYTLRYPESIEKPNDAWLLQGPSSRTLTKEEHIPLPYVKPTPSLKAPSEVAANTDFTVEGFLFTEKGSPLGSQPLTFILNNTDLGTIITDSAGKVSFILRLKEGSHILQSTWRKLNFSATWVINSIVPPSNLVLPNRGPQGTWFSVTGIGFEADAGLPAKVQLFTPDFGLRLNNSGPITVPPNGVLRFNPQIPSGSSYVPGVYNVGIVIFRDSSITFTKRTVIVGTFTIT